MCRRAWFGLGLGTCSKPAIATLKMAGLTKSLQTHLQTYQISIRCSPQDPVFEMPPAKNFQFVRPSPKILPKAMPERPTWEKHGINRPPPPVLQVASRLHL